MAGEVEKAWEGRLLDNERNGQPEGRMGTNLVAMMQLSPVCSVFEVTLNCMKQVNQDRRIMTPLNRKCAKSAEIGVPAFFSLATLPASLDLETGFHISKSSLPIRRQV